MAPTDMATRSRAASVDANLALIPSSAGRSSTRGSWLARLANTQVLVGLMVTVGIFDLVCTVTAYEQGVLDEMNPIARAVLEAYGSPGLAVFRFVATALSCVVLVWALRAYRARYALDHGARRVRAVIHTAVGVIVAAHVSLLVWWISWFSL
jgi:hypothetical protein